VARPWLDLHDRAGDADTERPVKRLPAPGLVAVSKGGARARRFVISGGCRPGWNAGRAPGSDRGDETSPPHQEPWCQSALPYRCAHAPGHVAAARAATLPAPPMPNGR
jgi:hypothetical protein